MCDDCHKRHSDQGAQEENEDQLAETEGNIGLQNGGHAVGKHHDLQRGNGDDKECGSGSDAQSADIRRG